MNANKTEIIEQAKYINTLAKRILAASQMIDRSSYQDYNKGTVKNLAPELSKEET